MGSCMGHRVFLVGCLLLCFGAQSLSAQDGGVSVLAPEPLYDREVQAYISYGLTSKTGLKTGDSKARNPSDLFLQQHRIGLGLNYALPNAGKPGDTIHTLTRDWTVSIFQPFLYKDYRTSASGKVFGDQFAEPGDFALLFRRRWLWWAANDLSGRALHISAVAGIEFPTGNSSLKSDDVRLPRSLQPGKGSHSVILANIFGWEADMFEAFATSIYRWRSIGSPDYDFGDSFSQEFKVAYRIVQDPYPGQSMSPNVGIRYQVSTPTKLNGNKLENSGSREIILRPGVIWHVFAYDEAVDGGLDINFSAAIPLYQDVNGTQAVTQFSLQVSVALRFTTLFDD